MITKFKLYEEINIGEPKIGDYVICNEHSSDDINHFIRNNIGRIFKFNFNETFPYIIKYSNIPESIDYLFRYKGNSREFKLSEIEFWSKNKEDLEILLAAKNFNL